MNLLISAVTHHTASEIHAAKIGIWPITGHFIDRPQKKKKTKAIDMKIVIIVAGVKNLFWIEIFRGKTENKFPVSNAIGNTG